MSYVPGHRPQREVINVDYADVLRQAVENERWRVLREVRSGLEGVQFFGGGYEWDKKPRSDATALKREVMQVVDRLMAG